VLICKHGDLFLSLPMDDSHLDRARTALANFADRHGSLIKDVLASND
jgi:hypothetical protein